MPSALKVQSLNYCTIREVFRVFFPWLHWSRLLRVDFLQSGAARCCGAQAWLQSVALEHTGCMVHTVVVHAVQSRAHGGIQAALLPGMWDPARVGMELMSPALAGSFLTTVAPGKSPKSHFMIIILIINTDCINRTDKELSTCD